MMTPLSIQQTLHSTSSPSTTTTKHLLTQSRLFSKLNNNNDVHQKKQQQQHRFEASTNNISDNNNNGKRKRKRLQFVYPYSSGTETKRFFIFPKEAARLKLLQEQQNDTATTTATTGERNEATSTVSSSKNTVDQLDLLFDNRNSNKQDIRRSSIKAPLHDNDEEESGNKLSLKEDHDNNSVANGLDEKIFEEDNDSIRPLSDENEEEEQKERKKLISTSTPSTDTEDDEHNNSNNSVDNGKTTKGKLQPVLDQQQQRVRSRSMSVSSITELSYGTTSIKNVLENHRGCKPRANSTDGELNLPQIGLCDERTVQRMYQWRTDKNNNASKKNVGWTLTSSTSKPRGLINMGNTCFLNATLQCLAYLPTFCQCLCYLSTANNNFSSKGQKMAYSFRDLLIKLHRLDNSAGSNNGPIRPNGIVKVIFSSSKNRFHLGRQEDSHELLVHLLDMLHEGELKQVGINTSITNWRQSLPLRRLDETTFIHRVFGGYLRSQVSCIACKYKSNTYDPMLDICLEISKASINSVDSALKDFTAKETLDTQNQWKCSGCHKRVCATKQLTIFRPPLTLCIQLKRFSFGSNTDDIFGGGGGGWNFGGGGKKYKGGGKWKHGGYGSNNSSRKISKRIQYPDKLRLPLSDKRYCEYNLTGVVQHLGSTPNSGHYTAYIKKPSLDQKNNNNNWYHMDDSHCTGPLNVKSVLSDKDAYILFYSRCEVDTSYPKPPFASAQEAKESKLLQKKIIATAGTTKQQSSTTDTSTTTTTTTTTTSVQPSKGGSIKGTFFLDPPFDLLKESDQANINEKQTMVTSMTKEDSTSSSKNNKYDNTDDDEKQRTMHEQKKKDSSNTEKQRDLKNVQLTHNKRSNTIKLKDAIGAVKGRRYGNDGYNDILESKSQWSDDETVEEEKNNMMDIRSTIQTIENKRNQQRTKHLKLDTWDAALDMGKKRKTKSASPSLSNRSTSFSLAVRHKKQQQQQQKAQGHGKGKVLPHKRNGNNNKNTMMNGRHRYQHNKNKKKNNKFHQGGKRR